MEWLDKAFALPEAEADAPLRQLRSELKVNRVERELFDLRREIAENGGSDEQLKALETELLELKLGESRKLVEQLPNDWSQRCKYGEYLFESGNIMAKELFDLALEQLKQPAESLTVVDELKRRSFTC